MSGRLEGAVAVVTGGGSGIGRAIAESYAREGARVAVCGRRMDPVREAVAGIEAEGGEALALGCDVTDDAAVERLVAEVADALGTPDVVVNNAGAYLATKFLDAAIEDFRRLVEVNYLGTVRVTKAFLPAMLERDSGKLVNIASTAGKYGSALQSPYNGSKHAVVGLTRSLALEFAATGVRINAICPGFVETPMIDGAMESFSKAAGVSGPELLEGLRARVPIGRFLQPEEIAHLAVYLGSRESDGMTGQALTISGGMVLV